MRTRILSVEELPRLAGTELGDVWPHYAQDSILALVVEDDDGRIVGCWGLMTVLHLEGLWIHPDHRNHGDVARRLLTKMRGLTGHRGVVTNSMDAQVTEYLTRCGAVPIPGQAFFWRMAESVTTEKVAI